MENSFRCLIERTLSLRIRNAKQWYQNQRTKYFKAQWVEEKIEKNIYIRKRKTYKNELKKSFKDFLEKALQIVKVLSDDISFLYRNG
jgi:hypothetical protein